MLNAGSVDVSKAEDETMALLPEDFVPGKWDVICQRGKECYDHVGNRRFRMIIDSHLGTYMEVMSRRQKTKIVTTIVSNIRSAAAESGGGFVRKDLLTRRWFKVTDKLAREKVGQALRDAIKTRRASGKKKASKGKKHLDSQGLRTIFDNEQVVSFPLSKNQSSRRADVTADEVPSSALQRSAADAARRAHPTASHVVEAQSLFFQQLSADLEPTPIISQQEGRQNLNLPDLFERNSMVHVRSEASASTLLRLFDEGATAKGAASAAKAGKASDEARVSLEAAARAAVQQRRLSLSSMAFHPIADQGASVMSLKNDFKFF